MSQKIKPYKSSENKKNQIIKMFDNIAPTYDLLNHFLSLRMDIIWRKNAIKKINNNPKKILDLATGTGDLAICAAKYTNADITAVDISKKMIDIGIKKTQKLENNIVFKIADAEKLPFSDNSYDAVTVGFGVRNFQNINKGLEEIYRVLKKKGMVVILEPSIPERFPIKQIYNLYFSSLLPLIGRLISKDKSAYKYFTESVNAFPSKNEFIKKLEKIGFGECKHIPLTFGIISLYIAIKK